VLRTVLAALVALVALAGCQKPLTCPRAIFLDGAGWYSGDGPVRRGLYQAGFPGPLERFRWSSLLGGPLTDHLLAGPAHPRVYSLAERITDLRKANPDGRIVVIGLSAGTSIIVYALEELPPSVSVDYVVLLSPSVSSEHDLTRALRHVKYRLYATSSPHDGILSATPVSAGMAGGRPAGLDGFRIPKHLSAARRKVYEKLINIPWRPEYVAYGWDGGHTSVTSSEFIQVAIGPRIMDDQPYPLDTPVVDARE
jgi:pimeloyl-ACP methyl ester carboxylesterase